MEQKTLFEIPIYSMAEKEFNKRWKKRKDFLYDMLIRGKNTEDDVKLFVSQSCFPECIWKYNQIIGFIQISVSRHDVRFDISLSLDKKYYAKSKYKHFIQDIHANGTHFYVSTLSNEYIKQNILEWLKHIEVDFLNKKVYVDYSTFYNIFDYVDIVQIMKSL